MPLPLIGKTSKTIQGGLDSKEDVHHLYTITLYNTNDKVMIQGNCRENWVMQEFPKFKSMIDDVLHNGTSLRDAHHSHMGKAIDFLDNDLLFSDCEDDEVHSSSDPADLQAIEPRTSSPKKSAAKKRKIASPRRAA